MPWVTNIKDTVNLKHFISNFAVIPPCQWAWNHGGHVSVIVDIHGVIWCAQTSVTLMGHVNVTQCTQGLAYVNMIKQAQF